MEHRRLMLTGLWTAYAVIAALGAWWKFDWAAGALAAMAAVGGWMACAMRRGGDDGADSGGGEEWKDG